MAYNGPQIHGIKTGKSYLLKTFAKTYISYRY